MRVSRLVVVVRCIFFLFAKMKPSASLPFMNRDNSLAQLKEPMLRRHSTTDKLFNNLPTAYHEALNKTITKLAG